MELTFTYAEGRQQTDLTVIERNGEIWFLANDVCNHLGLTNVTEALRSLENDEKLTSVMLKSGQNRNVWLISESGLYALIFKSRKDSAKRFRKWVTKDVLPSIRNKGSYGVSYKTHRFIKRVSQNEGRTDKGYFSVIQQLYFILFSKFEFLGYELPERAIDGKELRPDVSVGQCFANYLRTHHPELVDKHKRYSHLLSENLEVDAKQYPISMLPVFFEYVEDYWIPNNLEKYLKERDPNALKFLPELMKRIAV